MRRVKQHFEVVFAARRRVAVRVAQRNAHRRWLIELRFGERLAVDERLGDARDVADYMQLGATALQLRVAYTHACNTAQQDKKKNQNIAR